MTLGDEVRVVRALATASEVFLRLAVILRSHAGVREVSSPCSIRAEELLGDGRFGVGWGEGFRIEWYAEAEFANNTGLCFSQELSWHDGTWSVDASVRANDRPGSACSSNFHPGPQSPLTTWSLNLVGRVTYCSLRGRLAPLRSALSPDPPMRFR